MIKTNNLAKLADPDPDYLSFRPSDEQNISFKNDQFTFEIDLVENLELLKTNSKAHQYLHLMSLILIKRFDSNVLYRYSHATHNVIKSRIFRFGFFIPII